MKKQILIFLIVGAFVTVLLPSPPAEARKKRVVVGEVSGSGTSKHEIDTLHNLIESAVIDHKNAKLVTSDPTMEITASLNRLRRSYILIMTAELPKKQRSKQVKVRSFDEIDVAVTRVVAALIEGKNVEETAERGVVLKDEQKEPTRVKAINSYGVYIGGAVPLTNAMGSHKMLYSLGGSYIFDLDRFLIEIRADLQPAYNEIGMSASSFTFGGDYILHDARNFAFYTGLEIGFGHIEDANNNSTSGFATAANVGVLLFRYATVNLDIRFRTFILASKFNGSIPVTSGLIVGIIF